jgi:hypothetical protein
MGFFSDIGSAFKQGTQTITGAIKPVTKRISGFGNSKIGRISRGIAGATSFVDPTGASQAYTGLFVASDTLNKLNEATKDDEGNDNYVEETDRHNIYHTNGNIAYVPKNSKKSFNAGSNMDNQIAEMMRKKRNK